jgi:hypothetical protein
VTEPQTKSPLDRALEVGMFISVWACLPGAYLSNELAFSIPFYIGATLGVVYLVRRFIARRKRARPAQTDTR